MPSHSSFHGSSLSGDRIPIFSGCNILPTDRTGEGKIGESIVRDKSAHSHQHNFFGLRKNWGGWIYTQNFLRGLERYAKDVEIILLVSSSMAERFAQLSFEKRIVRMDPSSRWLRVGWEQLVLPRIVRFVGCDIFHSTGNVLPRRLSCRSIVT